jgi:hypothetical protein
VIEGVLYLNCYRCVFITVPAQYDAAIAQCRSLLKQRDEELCESRVTAADFASKVVLAFKEFNHF